MSMISGKTFGLGREESEIMSVIPLDGSWDGKKLRKSSKISLFQFDTCEVYLCEGDKLDSRAMRAFLIA